MFGYVAGEWRRDLSRHSSLMYSLAEHVPVVLLQGARRSKLPRVRPLRLEQRAEHLYIVHHVHPWQRSSLGRRMPGRAPGLDGRPLHRFLERHGFGKYVLWMMHDSLRRWHGMSFDRLVFDSIDPCFDPSWQEGHDRWERQLTGRAQVVFCTAQALLDRVRPINTASYLLPNACDPACFVERSERRDGSGLVFGYLGTFDARVDVRFLERLTEGLSDCRFVLAGRINADQEVRVAGLQARPNVTMPGRISNEAGNELLREIDVGLIPFIPGPAADAINPVKMHNYLAAGVPVVSTAIAECEAMQPPLVWTVDAGQDPSRVARAALRSADDPVDRERRRDWARRNTWAHRAAEAVRILSEHGLLSSFEDRPAVEPDLAHR